MQNVTVEDRACCTIGMTKVTQHTPPPALEIRCGGLHLTVQRVPGWLVAALTTATGSGIAAWVTSR